MLADTQSTVTNCSKAMPRPFSVSQLSVDIAAIALNADGPPDPDKFSPAILSLEDACN